MLWYLSARKNWLIKLREWWTYIGKKQAAGRPTVIHRHSRHLVPHSLFSYSEFVFFFSTSSFSNLFQWFSSWGGGKHMNRKREGNGRLGEKKVRNVVQRKSCKELLPLLTGLAWTTIVDSKITSYKMLSQFQAKIDRLTLPPRVRQKEMNHTHK